MKTVRSVTRAYLLLGAILLAGCAEKTTGPAKARILNLSERPNLKATVKTVVTYQDKARNVHRYEFTQKVRAQFKGGLARATAVATEQSANRDALFASMVSGGVARFAQSSSDYTSDATAVTPVLAVASSALGYNYEEQIEDSTGRVFTVYASAPDYGTPITDAWAYDANGTLVTSYHADWAPVSGGFALSDQTVAGYDNGTVAQSIYSVVQGGGGGSCAESGCVEPMKLSPAEKLGNALRFALNDLGCVLMPQTANAMFLPCWRTGLVFAGETFVMYHATVSGMAFVQPGLYFTGIGLWTNGLYDFLACIDDQYPRRRPRR